MPQMYPCERVGLDIFDGAPFYSRYTIESYRQATGASAEEYRIETTEHGCRLTWTRARRPRNPPSWLARTLARPLIRRANRKALKRLRKYTNQRFGPTILYTG